MNERPSPKVDKTELYRTVGAALRLVREDRRLTQAEIAERAGLQRTSVTNIESGRQHPPLHVLYSLCEVLGVDITDVIPATADVPRLFSMRSNATSGEMEELARELRRKIGGRV